MERLNGQNRPAADREPDLRIDILRHGPAAYAQPRWTDLSTADDLYADGRKAEAVRIVKQAAEKIAADIGPDEEVAVWSSPSGRTLETARILIEVLRGRGIKIRGKNRDKVKIFDHLGEVKNFSWPALAALMNGGDARYQGESFRLDKTLTNPDQLGYPEYFTSEASRKIPVAERQRWPAGFAAAVAAMESFTAVSARMEKILKRLKTVQDKQYRVIMVTHDGLTGKIAQIFTSGRLSGLKPGGFISLTRQNGQLLVSCLGDYRAGNNKEDIAP